MIAWAGAMRFEAGLVDTLDAPARARWPLDPDGRARSRRRGEGMKRDRRDRRRRLGHRARPGRGEGGETLLWAREPEVVESINRATRIGFPAGIRSSRDPRDRRPRALAGCDALLVVTPAQHMRSVLGDAAPASPLILCAKGIEEATPR
jgi:hypothetical protein